MIRVLVMLEVLAEGQAIVEEKKGEEEDPSDLISFEVVNILGGRRRFVLILDWRAAYFRGSSSSESERSSVSSHRSHKS
ncbi:hypothetical protein G5I_12551 [Acromyrmex echinatior]|uniref:Uncharacterized protein n=1 Tax=Acromyrmex echinatior TaxID=103372 RepID=F4X2M1_ACREC|nr:hypothetical protein G5I_12551 [Acromyrmex echinatior]